MARFNEIVPDGAARIFDEWEAEARHRRDFERRALTAEIAERIGGRVLAFVFAMSALGVAAYCAYVGQPVPAGIIGGGTIASVVAAFLYQRRAR